MQQFLQAVEADEFEKSYNFLSEELKQDCTIRRVIWQVRTNEGYGGGLSDNPGKKRQR